MRHDEHNLQTACVKWFRLQYPKYLIYAIPNGGQRNAVVGGKMKAEGVLPGMPDLHIPAAKGGFHGLYIEMKTGKNTPDGNQRTVMQKLQDEGYRCVVCYSFDEFRKEVNGYLGKQ
jgi:hypothetical protein